MDNNEKRDNVPLREYLEQRINSLCTKTELKISAIREELASRDKALLLQSEDNRRHFDALNNEAVRILRAAEMSVSRDTWNAFTEGYHIRHAELEKRMLETITRAEFYAFKENIEKEVMRHTAQGEGIKMSLTALIAVITAAAAIAGIVGVLITVLTEM